MYTTTEAVVTLPDGPRVTHMASDVFKTKCLASGGRPTPTKFRWLIDGREVTNPREDIVEENEQDEFGYHTVSEILETGAMNEPGKTFDLECRTEQGVKGYYGRATMEVSVVKTLNAAVSA